MNTISLPYTTSNKSKEIILKYMKNQNNVVKFVFNRLQENGNLKQKELTEFVNSMNNIFVDSWFKQSAVYKATEIYSKYLNSLKNSENKLISNEKLLEELKSSKDKDIDKIHKCLKDGKRFKKTLTVVFGGKKLFLNRIKNRISKEEFEIAKLIPLYVIGESKYKGNRKFKFNVIEHNKIIFKPEQGVKIDIVLPKLRANYQKILYTLQELIENKTVPITISIDLDKINITYDECKLTEQSEKIKNRTMSIDMNPNYIGYSVIDWIDVNTQNIVKVGMISIKKLNDKHIELKKQRIDCNDERMKYLTNKRHYEVYEIAKTLVEIAKEYKVENFGIENLDVKNKDHGQGKKYNRLVNNLWCRNKFVHNLVKRLNLYNIALYRISAYYSSFIGNLLNRDYPDCINASIEINRRTFCFINKVKPVVFPDFKASANVITKSLEEFSGDLIRLVGFESWKDLYKQVKSSRLRYRVSLESCKRHFEVFSLMSRKSLIGMYQFT